MNTDGEPQSNGSPWSRPDTQALGGAQPWWSAAGQAPGYPSQPAPGSPPWQQGPPPWQPVAPPAETRPREKRMARSVVVGITLIALGATAGAGIVDIARNAGSSTTAAASQPTTLTPGTSPGGNGGTFGGSSGGGTSGSGSGDPGSNGPNSGGSGARSIDAAAVARDVDPGIVDITTVVSGGEAAGTGMVLTSDGEVLTNNHVIAGAMKISVRDVGNGKTYAATVVGYDRSEDVAVLKLTNASGLTTVKTSGTVPAVGASVVGVGNAGGTGGTPSYAGGTVTSLGQSITASDASDGTSEQLTHLIQTDAGIEPGDSGGPLVNVSGVVIGMDTAASSSYSFRNQSDSSASGFAIPIATALKVASEIEDGQPSETVHVGTTAQLGVYVTGTQTSDGTGAAAGAIVEQTTSGGPAETAGISAGDSIVTIEGTSIDSPDALAAAISHYTPGQSVLVTVTTQDGTSHGYTVTLGTGTPQ